MMAGTSPAIARAQTLVISTPNEWERFYREINPPQNGQQVYAPALTDFAQEVLVIIRLSGTTQQGVIPTIDAFEQVDPITAVVRYSIWSPSRNDWQGNSVRTESIGDAVKRSREEKEKKNGTDKKPVEPTANQDKRRHGNGGSGNTPSPVPAYSPYVIAKASRVIPMYRFSGSIQIDPLLRISGSGMTMVLFRSFP